MTQTKIKTVWTYFPLNSTDVTTFNSQKAMTDNVRAKHEHTTGKGIELVRNFKNKENTFSTYLVYVGNGSNRKLVGTCKSERVKRGLIMKYIRTEYGIWQLDELDCIHHPYNGLPIHKSYLEILKEADTIEELCDEFVVERNNEHTIFHYFSDLQRHYNLYSQPYHHIKGRYGAIWTDKGLIYVAKLNDKGEWELL